MPDHIVIGKESAVGTFVSPAGDAIHVLEATSDPNTNYLSEIESGNTRDKVDIEQGTTKPAGNIKMIVRPETIMELLMAGGQNLVTSTVVAATSAYDHAAYPDDTAAIIGLSCQMQQTRNATTKTINLRGMQVKSWTLSCEMDQYLQLEVEYMAYEETLAGVAFLDTQTSPAAISITYAANISGFKFDHVAIQYGGTLTLDPTAKTFSLASGTALTGAEKFMVKCTYDNNQRGQFGQRYVKEQLHGGRTVEWEIDISDDTPATTFYTKKRDNTKEAITINFTHTAEIEASYPYLFQIVLPNANYQKAPFGNISGDQGARTLTIGGEGLPDTNDISIHTQLRDSNTSY